jgi:hypothetical protein
MVRAVDSRIEQVTVYARGARVRRAATLRGAVPGVVRFAGLPITVIDDTVRIEAVGNAVAAMARTGVEAPPAEVAAAEESESLRAARRRVALAEAEVARLTSALGRLERSFVEEDPSDEPPAAWSAVVAARRSLAAARVEREQKLRDEASAARREHEAAQRALVVELEKDARGGSARAAKLHELRKYVEVELASGSGDVTLRLEYQVAAARWAPSYVARLDGDRAVVEMRAVIAQASGEDWSGVALRLSTAEPERFAQLPELLPQKIGRRQQEPARRGFRPPPSGTEDLFADYDRSFPRSSRSFAGQVFDDSTFEGRMPVSGKLDQVSWDEESSAARAFEPMKTPPGDLAGGLKKRAATVPAAPPKVTRGRAAPGGPPPMQAIGMPPPAPSAGAAAPSTTPATAAAPPAMGPPTPRLDYGNLRMAVAGSVERGKLVPSPPSPAMSDAQVRANQAAARIAQLVLPAGCDAEWAHSYDYAYATEGSVDIASDAAWHSIAVTSRAGTVKVQHVAVPREQADVFRVAAIGNPFDGPLLPAPIDVYDRGQFLVTSEVDYTPPGARVEVGLGVDPQVKIARNVEFHEEATGMLRGGLRLVHAIAIDVENLSPRPIEVEVRERVPVKREGDDEVEVTIGKIEPAWERFTPDTDAPRDERLRGAHRWRISMAATSKQRLRATYEVKIAGKLELVGGNRREP